MKPKIILLYLLIASSILLLSSMGCVAQPAQQDKQVSSPPEVVNKREAAVVEIVVDGTVHPTRTPRTVESDGDKIELKLNLNKMPNVILKLNQKLVIIPIWAWGKEGWWVYTNKPEVLLLDPQIDHTTPPETGWVWTPQQIGKTRISILEPSDCPKCVLGPPRREIGFYVTVVDIP